MKNLSWGNKVVLVSILITALYFWAARVIEVWPELIFRVDSVKVVEVDNENHEVTLELSRWGWVPIASTGTYRRALVCANEIDYKTEHGIMRDSGYQVSQKTFPLAEAAFNGEDPDECYFRGLIGFRPFGNVGPYITVDWESETFWANRPWG